MSLVTNAGRTVSVAACCLVAVQLLGAPPAAAYPFTRSLQEGDRGRDVRALEVRVAGWYPSRNQASLKIDKKFTARTAIAVTAFQSFYGLSADGIAGPDTFDTLNNMQDADGSTVDFNWTDFEQNTDSGCSAKVNAYAGTFDGGMASPERVKHYVRRLMWRLEALRAKGGGHPIGINSGFRSVGYNECIGGAAASQHLYGTAADQRMANVANHQERVLGESSDFSGIGCYSQLTHNHFDIRLDNVELPSSQFWWWPQQNSLGQDLDDQNLPCYGETAVATSPRTVRLDKAAPLDVLTAAGVRAFAAAGETGNLGPGD